MTRSSRTAHLRLVQPDAAPAHGRARPRSARGRHRACSSTASASGRKPGGRTRRRTRARSTTGWPARSRVGRRSTPTPPLYQSRYLSNEGRLFFNSADALVPHDSNGREDVYEYEP